MPTSGTITYNQNRNEIITDVLQHLGVVGSGQTPTANDVTFVSAQLNKMVKAWENQGIHLWAEEEAVIALRNGVNIYNLSSTGDKAGKDGVSTTTTSIHSAGITTLVVSSVNGMNVSDSIGIQLDDNTMQWTTITAINTATLTLTLNAALTGSSSSGNTVIVYTTILGRPLNIISCRYKYNSGNERTMDKFGRVEFMEINNKNTTGPCTAFYFSPKLSTGKLYVWPTPNTCADLLTITYQRSIEDFSASTDAPDFPQEWLEPITFNLAVRVAPAFGISLMKSKPDILQIAKESLAEAKSWDTEEGSLYVVPDDNDY